MDLAEAITFARPRRDGALMTLRRDGRPQISNITYVFDGDDLRISVTESRAKTKNLRRDPRGSLYVPGDTFWAYAVLDGTVTLTPAAQHPDDEVADQLVSYYRDLRGEHPDWDDYRRAMVEEGRLVARFHPTHAYGMIRR